MSTNDIESVIEITKSLGDAYLSLLNTADADTGVEALEQIAQARQTTQENMEQDEYDFATGVTATFRATELKILSTVLPIMKPTCVAFENFSKSTNGKKFREYWNSTSEGVNNPLFTSNFRKLWRDSMNEELIVKIGTITKSSGAWPATVTSVYELAPVVAATTGVLPTTSVYSNGSSGVGATLTAGSAEALGKIDGVTINPGDRILVKNQTTATQNGIYIVSSIGSSSVKWILTRSTDADTASATEVSHGMSVYVTNGSVNGSKKFYMSTNSSVTMGSTNLDFTKTNLCPIETNENLELRVIGDANLPTTDEITATITIRKTDLTTSLHTITIPVNTVAGTGFTIGGSGVSVSGISIASDNGVDGDTLEIWVAGTTNALPLTTMDETDNIYQLHLFTLQDNRSELETLINSAVAGSIGSHTVVNITSASVYACPGRLTTNTMQNYVNVVGDSTGTPITIVCGNIIPDTCIFSLNATDRFYNRFSNSVRSKIKVVPLTNMGISMGAMFTSNIGPNDEAEKSINEPIVACLNGRSMTIACDSDDGLANWRVITGLGANTYRDITSVSEINGVNTFVTPASHTDMFAFIAHLNYATRVMKFSSVEDGVITFDQAPYSYSGGKTLLNSKVKFYNAPEFLTKQGEYFLSYETGRMYFIPWESEGIGRLSVSTPFGEWAGTNRAGAIFDLSASRSDALNFAVDRNNNIEGITFEACYNTPIRLGRYTKAKRINVRGGRYYGIMCQNPHNVEISSCTFNDLWRGCINVSFSLASYQLAQTAFTITGTDPSKTETINTTNVFADASYNNVLITDNDIERSGILWHEPPAVVINALDAVFSNNTITYTSYIALALGTMSESQVFDNYFQFCNQSLTEGGTIYSGRGWTQRASIYQNAFANIRRVRSGFGEDYSTCILLDDMSAGLTVFDNYMINCDYGIQLNSGQSEHLNNIFDNVTQSYVFVPFYAFSSTTPSSYTINSLRGAGILSRLVALSNHGSFNIVTHPVFATEQPGIISGVYLAALAAAVDPGTPGDGSAVLARKMTQAVTDGGFASVTTNGANGAYMMNSITVTYHPDTIINGSGIPTPPGVSNVGINIVVDGGTLTTYWTSPPVFRYPVAPEPELG